MLDQGRLVKFRATDRQRDGFEQGRMLPVLMPLGDDLVACVSDAFLHSGNPTRDRTERAEKTENDERGDRQTEGNALGNLGLAWLNLGEAQKGASFMKRGLEIFHEIGDQSAVGTMLGNLGLVWSNLGELDKAISYFEQQRELDLQVYETGYQQLADSDYQTIQSLRQLASHVSFQGTVQ